MADKSNKKDNYDVVGSIFDFIFEESKKPPEKRRKVSPPKYKSMYNPNQPILDDLITILEAPGVFLTSTAPKDIQDALELELLNIPIDEFGGFKITSSNIKKLFDDPNAFVDGAYNFAKKRRRAQQALFLGAGLADIATTVWAQNNGEDEIFKISLANFMAGKNDEEYVARRALGQYVKSRDALVESREDVEKKTLGQPPPETGMRKTPLAFDAKTPQVLQPNQLDFMAERGLDLLGEKTFGKEGWKNLDLRKRSELTDILSGRKNPLDIIAERTVGVRWKSMDEKARQAERRKLSSLADRDNKDGFARAEIQRYLANEYGVQVAKNFGKAARGSTLTDGSFSISNKHFSETDSIDVFNPSFYRHLERNNLVEKINTSTGEDKAKYQRILLLLESNKKGVGDRLKELNSRLSLEKDPNIRRDIRNEIKQVEKLSNLLGANNLLGRIGQLEGYLGSIKNVWIGEGVNPLKSIWDQSFFDPKKNNILNPVKTIGNGIGEAGRNVSFVIAKEFEGKGLLNAYNKFGEALYYGNPRTWVRSLVTGEGFAWIANRRVEGAKSILASLQGFEDIQKSIDVLIKTSNIADLEKNIQSIMGKINLQNGKKALTPQQLAKIESLLRKSTTFRKLADVFGTPLRLKNLVQKRILDATKELRRLIVRKIMQNKFLRDIIIKHGGSKLMGKFVVQGSLKALIQSIVSSIGGAIGLPAGPLAIVTFVVTWIVTEIVWQVGKVLIKVQVAVIKFQYQVIKLVVLGILGLFFVFLAGAGSSISKYNSSHYTSSNVTPGSVEICDAYNLGDGEDGEGENGDPGDFPGLDIECAGGETIGDMFEMARKYISDTFSVNLSTQLQLVDCDLPPGQRHPICSSIGGAWCYASDKIYCRTVITTASCEYLTRLFIHELVHKMQPWSGCGDGKMREWGADYISGNAGNYWFQWSKNKSTCFRATQVPNIPGKCTHNKMMEVASCLPGYDTDCYRAVNNEISDYYIGTSANNHCSTFW